MNKDYERVKALMSDDIETQFSPKILDYESMEKGIAKTIAKNITTVRKTIGVPQGKMAKIFGVSLSQYKKFELGIEIIKVDTAQKFSLNIGIPFFNLLFDTAYELPLNKLKQSLSYQWYFVNSLSDEYFLILVNILRAFSQKTCREEVHVKYHISEEIVKSAVEEIDSSMYVLVAKGLKKFRERFNISQEDMSQYIGVSLTTYKQYEKETNTPRFSFLMAARFFLSTGISPLALLKGSDYSIVRYMQEERMELLRNVVSDLDEERLARAYPVVYRFFEIAKITPGALLLSW